MTDAQVDGTVAARRTWPLVVRVARPDDRAAVMTFATKTWNGWDYMPHAWDRWLQARDGVMLVGVVGDSDRAEQVAESTLMSAGTVVAVVRVAIPAPGEAWLEGIRVDPRVRGMDVATDLQVAELHWAAANGADIVRYATSARNEGSHRLGVRGGLELIAQLPGISWEVPRPDDGEHDRSGFQPDVQAGLRERRGVLLDRFAARGWICAAEQAGVLWETLAADDGFNRAQRLYEPRPWALEELTEQKFRAHAVLGEVIIRRNENVAIGIVVRDVAPAEEVAIRFAILAGSGPAAFQIVEGAREQSDLSVRLRYADGAAMVADHESLYRDAGYTFGEWPLHIMARPIDAAHPLPEIDPEALILEDRPEALITAPR